MMTESLDRFVAAFNANDLDAVMTSFAEGAIYRPGDGREHCGSAAIRAAFRPQFEGAFGTMRFDLEDRLIDEGGRKAAIRWICRHDFSGAHGRRIPLLKRLVYRLLYGARCGWRGVDVFHFDATGLITEKHTYANYGRPLVRRELAG